MLNGCIYSDCIVILFKRENTKLVLIGTHVSPLGASSGDKELGKPNSTTDLKYKI